MLKDYNDLCLGSLSDYAGKLMSGNDDEDEDDEVRKPVKKNKEKKKKGGKKEKLDKFLNKVSEVYLQRKIDSTDYIADFNLAINNEEKMSDMVERFNLLVSKDGDINHYPIIGSMIVEACENGVIPEDRHPEYYEVAKEFLGPRVRELRSLFKKKHRPDNSLLYSVAIQIPTEGIVTETNLFSLVSTVNELLYVSIEKHDPDFTLSKEGLFNLYCGVFGAENIGEWAIGCLLEKRAKLDSYKERPKEVPRLWEKITDVALEALDELSEDELIPLFQDYCAVRFHETFNGATMSERRITLLSIDKDDYENVFRAIKSLKNNDSEDYRKYLV